MSEESLKDKYNRIHGDTRAVNMAAFMDRKKYGLTGDWDTDVAAGKIEPNGDSWKVVS